MNILWNKPTKNKPTKIPIPLFKNEKFKLSYVINKYINKIVITKIVIVSLKYKIDLSRLNVMELDNNNKSSLIVIINDPVDELHI